MKVSDYIASTLAARGVTHVFEVIGGMTTHLIDSLGQRPDITVLSVHHEQAAAFAADSVGRLTGVPGVAMATSGPGATNLLTGIGSCHFDSSPAVFITGQVNRSEQKGERPIRQLGFQETDIVAMAAPITKAAWRVRGPEEIPDLLARAFDLAVEGRPGPVLLDIPMDVQRAEIEPRMEYIPAAAPIETVGRDAIRSVLEGLARASRPLVLVGGGLRASRSASLFRQFALRLGVPVVNSLMAVDALPWGDPLRVGLIGSYGNRWVNLAVGRADFLLVLGSRLDIRQTGADVDAFKEHRTIVHVDCDAGEVNNRVTGCDTILSHLGPFLHVALDEIGESNLPSRQEWLGEIAALRAAWPDTGEIQGTPGINPNVFMHELSRSSGTASAYVVDVGQHQMWAAQSLELNGVQAFMTSGGMGAMGFALPAAIGTTAALPGEPVVMIAGDGGFQVNIQELETVKRGGLPIKMVVLNNRCHGMVRQFQQSYFQERYHSTYWGYSAPDFAKVAQAYGIDAATVETPEGVETALSLLWQDPEAPFLLQVMIDTFANAYPKIAFGRPMTEMEPFAKPVDMEGT